MLTVVPVQPQTCAVAPFYMKPSNRGGITYDRLVNLRYPDNFTKITHNLSSKSAKKQTGWKHYVRHPMVEMKIQNVQ